MKAEYINHMGNDLEVVDAARVSFDKVSEWEFIDIGPWQHSDQRWELVKAKAEELGRPVQYRIPGPFDAAPFLKDADARLIRFLADHDHWTPFAHTAIKLRMQAPLPIRTQCFKHKLGFVENEQSRRYISTRPDLFVPDIFRSKPEGSAKQGSAGRHPDSDHWRIEYILHCKRGIELYEVMVADGVCPEQARFVLPQGVEVQWVWTGNLPSYARLYRQRTDPHAQVEIQELARMVGKIIEPLFPVSWKALTA